MASFAHFRRQLLYRWMYRAVERKTGRTVLGGPFAGVRYPAGVTVGNALASKFLGTYECELHEWWQAIRQQPVGLVVDVGAAEGYYVAGLARLFPAAHLIAFETGTAERDAIGHLAASNGFADRVRVEGWCTAASLRATLAAHSPRDGRRTLVIMDVEGGEFELLATADLPALAQTILVVEMHDPLFGGSRDAVADAFAPSHAIRRVPSRPRRWEDIPPVFSPWLRKWLLHVASDQRLGQQEWLCMLPRDHDA